MQIAYLWGVGPAHVKKECHSLNLKGPTFSILTPSIMLRDADLLKMENLPEKMEKPYK
jgi:hypothetical protein